MKDLNFRYVRGGGTLSNFPYFESLCKTGVGGKTARLAFTLAEVLITLGIIGVVAALTIPSLVQKHQEQVTVTKLKKFYSAFSQAYTMAVLEHGTLDNWGLESSELVEDEDGNSTHSEQSFEQYDKFFNIIDKYLQKGDYKKLHSTTGKNDIENSGYILSDGTRIVGLWLSDPSGCVTSKPTYYCGDFYVVTDNKNYYDKDKNFKKNAFAFKINPERIFPLGNDENSFKNYCLNGKNYARCTGWVITHGNMDYLHCNDLSWNGKTKCK